MEGCAVDVRLHLLPGGQAARPTDGALIFCHAAGYLGKIWMPVSLALSADWPRFAVDFHGHADSASLPSTTGWDIFRDDVIVSAARIPAARLIGVGHSLGATALLLAEAARPDLFTALLCYEPIFATGFDPAFANSAERRRSVFESADAALAHLSAKPSLRSVAPEMLRVYVDEGFASDPGGGVRLRCDPGAEAHIYRTAASSGWQSALSKVRCPVHLVRGEQSVVVSRQSLARACCLLPNAVIQGFTQAGHLGPLERPQAFARLVDQFLAGMTTRSQ
jgi:pimeloyl-ACP methyl ester carboxylesterase